MDKDTLVETLIEDGQKLVEQLPQGRFEVTTAFWLKASEDLKWRFYIVSPIVDSEGITLGYGRLLPLIRQMPQPFDIDPLKVKLIGPSDPIAREVLAALKRIPGPRSRPIQWSGNRLGNLSIEAAYLYPLPVAASS